MNRRETLRVEISQPKVRLDKFLQKKFSDISRGTFQRLIQDGNVLVDGKTTKTTHHPKACEEIMITWPNPQPSEVLSENIPLEVLFEDECLLVINKPPGLVVHPAAGHTHGTLVNALLHHCAGELSGVGGVARPGIVHRLDKDTSGCLVVAKHDSAHLGLSAQFAKREITKIYQALVCGQPQKEQITVQAPIARHPVHRKKMAIVENGRSAHTDFLTLEILNESALVEAKLHTGRTHQIRVHLQHLGYPLIGDKVYGGRPARVFSQTTGYNATRQMLHASELGFTHPHSGETILAKAPLPTDFVDAMNYLKIR